MNKINKPEMNDELVKSFNPWQSVIQTNNDKGKAHCGETKEEERLVFIIELPVV